MSEFFEMYIKKTFLHLALMSFRMLLLPFSFIYGLAVFFRNMFFDLGIFTEKRFEFPLISIGNLTTGGTGKTPHVEYIIRLLISQKSVATLSRGYGRRTSGFNYVFEDSKAEMVGDEPLQLKNKFKNITVAVCESRMLGIEKIIQENPLTDVILLDDAFQHRSVKAGFSVLLLEYSKIFSTDFLLPAGNLREPISSKKRADIIVISKCPQIISDEERKRIVLKVLPETKQKLFFSSLVYAAEVKSVYDVDKLNLTPSLNVLLVTGIADARDLKAYVQEKSSLVKHMEFSDHHAYTLTDIKTMVEIFSTIATENKIILTTEKDAMRLKETDALRNIPLYFQPVEIKIHVKDEAIFNNQILEYVGKN
ncbi:MAG: Tetraacyldisaccharide 4'-kinase [Bacteroidia bacterium]|nr:Tetraacyldisaccharide 4'-kinase [Bacteroidia bacterium]